MINTNFVLMQARNNLVPPTWQVYRGRPSFFLRQVALGGLLLVLATALAVYLVTHPFTAVTVGYVGGDLDPQTFSFTRMADIVALGIFAIISLGAAVWYSLELSRVHHHVLVLLPEGFAMGTSKAASYTYGAIREMKIVNYRGTSSLKIYAGNAQKSIYVRFDGRFGNPRQVTRTIYAMWKNYAFARSAMQPPSWY